MVLIKVAILLCVYVRLALGELDHLIFHTKKKKTRLVVSTDYHSTSGHVQPITESPPKK